MSLYPSLEDMKVDQMAQVQYRMESSLPAISAASVPRQVSAVPSYPLNPTAPAPGSNSTLYPSLHDFMGLELTPEMIEANMPHWAVAVPEHREVAIPVAAPGSAISMVAPLSGQSLGLRRAQVTHGVRELVLCKDGKGKVGLRVRAVNKGVFACLVQKGSPAAMAGLRFGDQILEINGIIVAGFSMDQVHSLFRKSDVNNIRVVVRDRPFERTLTMHKDSTGHIGFQFKKGKIVSLVKDSSAARNGLLTEHHLLEVNGQNVVGIDDKAITKIIQEGGQIITVTIIPSFIYDHMIKQMATGFMKSTMDHSIPDI